MIHHSGTTTLIVPITGAARVEALAFAPNGTLFASGSLDDNASSETLFTLDVSSGVLSVVGGMALADLDEMTFAQDGFLYGVDSRAGTASDLYQINPSTGQVQNLGSTGVLEATGIMAVPESSRFRSISPLADGRIQLTVAAEEGHAYEIQRSTDLRAWQPLALVTNTAETFTYIDATPRNPLIQFYRSTLLSR